ncbi:hypothetical protein DFQ29_002281 [Apophysomyces sp. BC1021]|nr:hypothetical protein DFQ29_002281 [Apophysomyces sp. BC1021]
MEKLPQHSLVDLIDSETELWSAYGDAVLDALLSDPENKVHLRWTNQRCNDGQERPDAVISIINQSTAR